MVHGRSQLFDVGGGAMGGKGKGTGGGKGIFLIMIIVGQNREVLYTFECFTSNTIGVILYLNFPSSN